MEGSGAFTGDLCASGGVLKSPSVPLLLLTPQDVPPPSVPQPWVSSSRALF